MSKPINVSENLDADIEERYRDVGTTWFTQIVLLLVQGLRYQRRILAAVETIPPRPEPADRLELTLGAPEPKP